MALKKDSRRALLAGMTAFFVVQVVYKQTLIKCIASDIPCGLAGGSLKSTQISKQSVSGAVGRKIPDKPE